MSVLKNTLGYLNISSEEIYKLFNLQVDPNIIAREYLQLSIEEYSVVHKPAASETEIKAFYNLKAEDSLQALKEVTTFLKTTNLSGAQLRELLFQNLSEAETNEASSFFINHNLGGYAKLDVDEKNIIWFNTETGGEEAIDFTDEEMPVNEIPMAWFERVNRLVRLSNKINISITDLDTILRNCCANKLEAMAIQRIGNH